MISTLRARCLPLIMAGTLVSLACGGTSAKGEGGGGGSRGSGGSAAMDAAIDLETRCTDVAFEEPDPQLPCEVDAILSTKCQRCHDVEEVTNLCEVEDSCAAGPFPLRSWEDTRADVGGKPAFMRMYDAVESGFMPLTVVRSIQPPVEPLTATEKEQLLGWLAECGPPGGDATCE